MRIIYVSQARFPTEKAHGHQMAQVCAALAHLNHAVTLVAPGVAGSIAKDPREFYGLREGFQVERLPVFDALRAWWVPGFLAFAITMRSYGKALRAWLPGHKADLLYTRSPHLLRSLLSIGIPVVLELHTLPHKNASFIADCNRCRLVVCLTQPMCDALVSWGVDPQQITVEGDGVDPRRFENMPNPEEAKRLWRLPPGRPVAGYVGSLITRGTIEKGISELLQAFALLKRRGVKVFGWVIGGPRDHIAAYRAEATALGLQDADIRFEGPVHSPRIPSALAACDLCVYPAPASEHRYFQRDTSPLKVFEYLAAGKPVVCADIPPLRGVIDPELVHLCVPGDVTSLADAIAEALTHPKGSDGRRAALIAHVSWEARMQRILSRIL